MHPNMAEQANCNPTYAGDFDLSPIPERLACLVGDVHPMISAGVKTITHNRLGLKIKPHKVVAIEMQGSTSFDLTPSFARIWAQRLIEFAQSIESEKS